MDYLTQQLTTQERLNSLYSKFDEAGTPIQDASGKPITKNAKKFQKGILLYCNYILIIFLYENLRVFIYSYINL